MWVIVVNRSIDLHRDNRISELFGEQSNHEYLYKRTGNSKYSKTSNVIFALTFKTESGAKRLVGSFNSDTQKHFYQNKFNWISDCFLSIRKMTTDEWNQKINFELSILENRYKKQKDRLLKKREEYK